MNTSLNNLINYTFINYSGCLIERTGTGFKIFGKEYPTLYLAKKKIDLSFLNFSKSIHK